MIHNLQKSNVTRMTYSPVVDVVFFVWDFGHFFVRSYQTGRLEVGVWCPLFFSTNASTPKKGLQKGFELKLKSTCFCVPRKNTGVTRQEYGFFVKVLWNLDFLDF